MLPRFVARSIFLYVKGINLRYALKAQASGIPALYIQPYRSTLRVVGKSECEFFKQLRRVYLAFS